MLGRLLILLGLASAAAAAPAPAACRDRFLQPFAPNSIWNTAIGGGAVYSPASIYNESSRLKNRGPPPNFHSDQDWIVRASASDPLTEWINDAGQVPQPESHLSRTAHERPHPPTPHPPTEAQAKNWTVAFSSPGCAPRSRARGGRSPLQSSCRRQS